MKLCFLVNQLSTRDGWGSYSVSLIKHLAKKGIDCRVLLSVKSQQNDLPEIKNYKVLPPLFVSRFVKLFFLLKNFQKIKKLVQWADLVHVLVEPYSPIAYWTAKKTPYLITCHGTYAVDHFRRWYLRLVYRQAYQKAKKIICVSHFTKKEILQRISLKNTTVINNGVDYQKFQRVFPKQEKENYPLILSVGALMPRKGYHISIEAISLVKKKYPDLRYCIVGSQKNKDYFDQLEKLSLNYNLNNNLVFLENISEDKLIRLYSQSNLFLLIPIQTKDSKFEGFGLVYLEANACGIPVIGTYGCGAEEAIKSGYNGLLVPQNNPRETAEAITEILENRSLFEKMNSNARKWAQQMDWSNVVLRHYLKTYEQILNQEII